MLIIWIVLIMIFESMSFQFKSCTNIYGLKSKTRTPDKISQKNMFSGIVEEMGIVNELLNDEEVEMWDGTLGKGTKLKIKTNTAFEDSYIGCSVAVNGVCLTATELDEINKCITFGLAPETLRRTNLGKLIEGNSVNLERALRADGRNSGHFVQGHVDCTGKILNKWKEGDSLWIKVKVDSNYLKYIVPKGFICIDGTSLTICDVSQEENWFTFMLIAHTQSAVIIPSKEVGDEVNIEVDVLAKMVEQSMENVNNRLNNLEATLKLITEKLK